MDKPLEWLPLHMTPQDQEWREFQEQLRREVLSVFALTQSQIGVVSDINNGGNNGTQHRRKGLHSRLI